MPNSTSSEREPLLPQQHVQIDSSQTLSSGSRTTAIKNDNETPDDDRICDDSGITSGESPPNGGTNQAIIDDETATTANSNEHSTLQLLSIVSGEFLGAFLVSLDSTLVATLSASISSSFSNMPLLGWLASSYFIASAASQPVAGKLTDIFGRRNGLVLASVVFGFGNILCALAQREWQLLLGRLISGLGGGAIYPIGTIILSDLVPLHRRGLWQGIGNICFTLGSGIGGPCGGWIDDAFGWRWAFAAQVPITVISIILMLWRLDLPIDKEIKKRGDRMAKLLRVDFIGAVLSVSCVVLLLTSLSSGGSLLPWSHPLVLGALIGSAITLVAFIAYEYKVANDPIIPVALVGDRTIAGAFLANWLHPMARFGLLFYAPIYFQIKGLSAGQTGLRFLPDSFAVGLGAVGSGVIMQITGKYYALSVSQQLLVPIGIALFATLNLSTPAWPPFIYLFFPGLGVSGMLTTTLIALLANVEQKDMASMTSALYVLRSTGSVIGISAASTVYQNKLKHQLRSRLSDLPNKERLIRELQESLSRVFELPDDLKISVQEAYIDSLRVVYLMLVVFGILGVLSSALMKETPLLTKTPRRLS